MPWSRRKLSAVPPILVLGTGNRHKLRELADLMAPTGIRTRPVSDFPCHMDVEESADSLAENARRKASLQAKHLGQWVLGDDTGLMIDALDQAPGVLSARYAGPDADAAANRRRVLDELAGVKLEQRTGRFVCRLALADPCGEIRAESEGFCRGRIRFEPAGELTFGYDPLFEIVEYHRTFAELGHAAKSRLGHRGRAVERLLPELKRLIGCL